MTSPQPTPKLDHIDHVAVTVSDVAASVDWYVSTFHCEIDYQDETWALLRFENMALALVIGEQHPPHVAVRREDAEKFGKLVTHRDGSRSIYVQDAAGNAVEVIEPH